MGLVKRMLGFNVNHSVKLVCYTMLIRPILEYCTYLWSPVNKQLITYVESVQRQFTKYILNDYTSSYKERLIECSLLPLTFRREYLQI